MTRDNGRILGPGKTYNVDKISDSTFKLCPMVANIRLYVFMSRPVTLT